VTFAGNRRKTAVRYQELVDGGNICGDAQLVTREKRPEFHLIIVAAHVVVSGTSE